MTWLTWRQHRTQTWIALAVVVALALALAVAWQEIGDLYRQSGLATCTGDRCSDLGNAFLAKVQQGFAGPARTVGQSLTYLLPGLIGAFWGAPLVGRELETGTFRLAWTQSVTRTRWLATKLALLGASTLVTAGAVALVVTWSSRRVDGVQGRMEPLLFGARGVVPVAYALLAFAIGVLAGILLRRTLPAMATTLAVVAGIQLAMPTWIRGHLVAPLHLTQALDPHGSVRIVLTENGHAWVRADVNLPGAWVLSDTTVTPSGTPFNGVVDPAYCSREVPPGKCVQWLADQQLHSVVAYQPAGRFWTLQWIESGILVALALLVIGLCFWALRRRVA
jgi:ABC-type transport system involved in multi-copper enzyme maturation permease subunit